MRDAVEVRLRISAHTVPSGVPSGVYACIMQEEAAPRAVQVAGACHFLFGPRQVDFGGVLHQQPDLLLRQALACPGDVWLEYLVEGDLRVVKEAISGLHLGPPATRRRNAQMGPVPQRRQQQFQTGIQTFVAQIRDIDFLLGPWRDHCATPLTRFVGTPSVGYNDRLSAPDCQGHRQLVWNNEGVSPWLPACAASPPISSPYHELRGCPARGLQGLALPGYEPPPPPGPKTHVRQNRQGPALGDAGGRIDRGGRPGLALPPPTACKTFRVA